MKRFHRLSSVLRSLFCKRKLDAEMDEEMRSHIEMRTQLNLEAGMPPEEARFAACRQFGWAESIKETCRERRGTSLVENFLRDTRFGFRQLQKNPGFTSIAVLTIAICLGANLTIFAVIDSVLVRPLPFPGAETLVTMFNTYPKAAVERDGSSLANYYDRRGNIPAFSHISVLRYGTAIVGEAGSSERVEVLRVSPEFFATLGIAPIVGRAFTEDETTYQTDKVAILTDSYWRRHFKADPNVLGREIRVDGFKRLVIGVLPPNYQYLSSKAQLYFPLSSNPEDRGPDQRHAGGGGTDLIARLKPGSTLSEAQSQIDANNAALAEGTPHAKEMADAGFRTVLTPLHADHVKSIRTVLLLLQAGVLFLLLIGGVNLVNLLLIRASSRAKELAVRQSLGANRRHVIMQAMVETELLTLVGGVAGLAVGAGGIRLLAVLGVDQLPLGARVAFDGRVALVTLVGAVVTGLAVGLPIAWFNIRSHLASALQSESRGGTVAHAAQRLRHSFVIAQIALAFVLLAGAGLLGVSLRRAMSVSPGFRPDHILTGQISLPWKTYQTETARLAFADRLLEDISHQPGVTATGVINNVPLSGHSGKSAVTVKGYVLRPGESPRGCYSYGVAGNYFIALGIPLRDGRFLDGADSHRSERVCVVDEDFARFYWSEGRAIGQRLFEGSDERKEEEAFTIVGVVGAVKQAAITEDHGQGAVYFPYKYRAENDIFVVSRTSQSPEFLGNTLQKVVRAIDPELPVNDLRSMEARITDSLVARRSPALLTDIFAGVALLLAAIGTYGVLSFAVTQRHREIGVRLALGALPKQIARRFLSLGLRLVAAGTILGIVGAWIASRAMQSILFHVPTLDVVTFAGAAVVMMVVSLVACLQPMLRAGRVEPMDALRAE